MNGWSLLALIGIALALLVAYRLGRMQARREMPTGAAAADEAEAVRRETPTGAATDEPHAARLRGELTARDARIAQLEDFAHDRCRLYGELADARAHTARYRQIVVDLENNAPPPILGERGAPDDLKLIVGIGPVLERMLQQLGIATYRQIARWTERDIDDMDARLAEFPGRIRRDAWVVQARALHRSKYGEQP